MDLKRALLVFAAFCVSPGVSAATYVYTGAPYTLVQDFIAPCGAGPCANYALGEKITGQFTTAVPLAPNLSNQNVLPSVTSYSFTDGVDTYSSADLTARVDDFVASTDSSGNINAFDVMIIIWQTGTSPHTAGDRVARFRVSSSFTDIAENDAPWRGGRDRTEWSIGCLRHLRPGRVDQLRRRDHAWSVLDLGGSGARAHSDPFRMGGAPAVAVRHHLRTSRAGLVDRNN